MLRRRDKKEVFAKQLSDFASTLGRHVSRNDDWTIKGFIDIFRNIYTISSDTKIVSKILELHLFPRFLDFARENNYELELATRQNWYPDLTLANIGSIQYIEDILNSNGVFARAGEKYFDDYWANFGKLQVETSDGKHKALSSFDEYLEYRGLSSKLKNPRPPKKKTQHE
ncbi:hypothetical protein FACS1894204_11940 [Synergistales bacterium]|nr:hypothetical protein FACS1894204_11940 [Synergistales bacterium]